MEEINTQNSNTGDTNELELVKKEREEYLDGWKRAKADFINYKNEEMERTKKFSSMIKELILGDFLPVLDSFEIGMVSVKDEESKKGMELIKMQLEEAMKRHGLERIPVVLGDEFNPVFHEAIGEKESEFPDGHIAEEFAKGYILHGKVLRPVRVKISKGSTNNK